MTIVVFDGATLAADRGVSDGDTLLETSKIVQVASYAVAGIGSAVDVARLVSWWSRGAEPKEYPLMVITATLLVVHKTKGLTKYAGAYPDSLGFSKCAFGTGRQFALGAMAMGASAEQAAKIACEYDPHCGHGVDTVALEDL